MILRRFLLLSSVASIDAFLTPPSSPLHVSSKFIASSWKSSQQPASVLYADASAESEGDGTSEEIEDAGLLPSEEALDILNSPAFLKRKVDVLQSDIAATEKEIEEANAVYLQGKEEWGSKFDMLNKEVRSGLVDIFCN